MRRDHVMSSLTFFRQHAFFLFFCWRSIVYFCREGAQLKVIAPKLASGTLASVVPGQVNGKKKTKQEKTNQRKQTRGVAARAPFKTTQCRKVHWNLKKREVCPFILLPD